MSNKAALIKSFLVYSTPEISDALDGCGLNGYLDGIKPIFHTQKIAGFAYTVQYQPITQRTTEFMPASNYIDNVPQGAIVLIDNQGNTECSVWGGILSYFASSKKITGTVVHGMVRDQHFQQSSIYPIYACGITARTGKNRVHIINQQCKILIGCVEVSPNDIIFCDSNGVVVIPIVHAEKILRMTQNISNTESKILKAINEGKTLEEARALYHYERPWEE